MISAKNDTQKVIANTYANSLGNDENRANAKLITAAPKMYEALEDVKKILRGQNARNSSKR